MLDFEIQDVRLWAAVLQQLQSFGCHRMMLSLLQPLSHFRGLVSLQNRKLLAPLWKSTIRRPFIELNDCAQRLALQAGTRVDSKQGGFESSSDKTLVPKLICGLPISIVEPILNQVVLLLEQCPFPREVAIASFVPDFLCLGTNMLQHALNVVRAVPTPEERKRCLQQILAFKPEPSTEDIDCKTSVSHPDNWSAHVLNILGTKYLISFNSLR
jgi:hypothetical protein